MGVMLLVLIHIEKHVAEAETQIKRIEATLTYIKDISDRSD